MQTYYFTFGQSHTHPKSGESMKDYWIEITASSEEAASEKMIEMFGQKWGSQYEENNFRKEYYPKGRFAHFSGNQS